MTKPLRLATRGSQLALTQSGHVAAAITQATGRAVELVVVRTRGDVVTDRPLAQVGGKGLFTKEIEDALLARDAEIAVHSMKDMPTDQPEGLTFGAIPPREDVRDVLVGACLAELPPGAVVGTGSARRVAQLRALRPDLDLRGIRGNVDTRIRKVHDGDYQAIVLAAAGLRRLGRAEAIAEPLSPEQMVPAVGQGALAVQCRSDDAEVLGVLARIHHRPTAHCVRAERAFLRAIAGGCSVPAGCLARLEDGILHVHAFYATSKGLRRASRVGETAKAEQLGVELAEALR
ncbi:MAG: hydroxymethylbilane synthase [Deltaproteobacteria bacterium]|nr:MAG: hydroxymethylbilane synthase [Deltaproteobacteria bacterium]